MILELTFLFFIVFRSTKFFVRDVLFNNIRFKIGGLGPKIDYLFTCYWCMGIYVALAATIIFTLATGWATVLTFLGIWAMLASLTGILGDVLDKVERT